MSPLKDEIHDSNIIIQSSLSTLDHYINDEQQRINTNNGSIHKNNQKKSSKK